MGVYFMILTGQNILILPEIKQLTYVFNNLNITSSGLTTIGFYNKSGIQLFGYSLSGRKIFSVNPNATRNISSYNENQNIIISGNCITNPNNTGFNYLDHTINGAQINSFTDQINNSFYSLQINIPIGQTMNSDISLTSIPVNYNLSLPSYYIANSETTGTISSDTSFWILDSNTTFFNSYQPILSIDSIFAPIDKKNGLSLNLNDQDPGNLDYIVNFQSYIFSNIGQLVISDSIVRTGNFNNVVTQFFGIGNQSQLSGEFDGTWQNNNFTFSDETENLTNNYFYNQTDSAGNTITTANIFIKFEPVFPLNGQTYTSQYITGFQVLNSGEYLYPPNVNFSNYYYITGLFQQLSSMLFSSGCTGNIPINFPSQTGANASGYLSLLPILLQNIYGTGMNNYNIATAYTITNSGTGYINSPIAILNTGIYSNCYDIPSYYGNNLSIFSNFNTSGILSPEASYLTGIVLTTTGLVSGGQVTGYLITGLDISNIGYGYDNNYLIPKINFIRQSGDNLTHNATGLLINKISGLYNINNFWTILTGWTTNDFSPLSSGLSGILTMNRNYFSISINCSGLDNTNNVISKLTLMPSNGPTIIEYITGSKYYNNDPFFLKKKIDIAQLIFPSGSILDFLTSQNDLDNFYDNTNFTNNTFPPLGSLSF
jgi:hypothetical protein